MYLIEIDIKTGLVSEDPRNSGWRAIKEFKALYDKYGLEGVTVLALSVDNLSMFKSYSKKDRVLRSVDEVFNSRTKIDIESDLFLEAVNKYEKLQFNPKLKQERIYEDIYWNLLNKLEEAQNEQNDVEIESLSKRINKHNEVTETFKKGFDKEKAISMAVTSNGYELSRIEADLKTRKNSKFLSHGKNFENPNKLGITN